MKLPYGRADFKSIREDGYLYVDKTRFIEELENLDPTYLFFIRPRRFGKSLLISTLYYYYDLAHAADFEKLYGDLYIGRNPTPRKNSYLVLRFDFSGIRTENHEVLLEGFRNKVITGMRDFLDHYADLIPSAPALKEKLEAVREPSGLWTMFMGPVKATGKKIYLLIDEYDHFANDIIAMGESALYKTAVRGTGFVRKFYECIKTSSGEGAVDRILMLGASPVMLDDLATGFNITENITLYQSMNELPGFTEKEVSYLMKQIGVSLEEHLPVMRRYYNGYLFHPDAPERIYNSDMTLFYLNQLKNRGRIEKVVDENVRMDYARLKRLTRNRENREQLLGIIEKDEIHAMLQERFSFDAMFDRTYFVSLMFYMGLLTIKESAGAGGVVLASPNHVIRTLYWEYFRMQLHTEAGISPRWEEVDETVRALAMDGNPRPFLDFIRDNVLAALSRRDHIKFHEKYIKVVLLSILSMSQYYRPVSEREVSGGYVDLLLERDVRFPDTNYEWYWELKYVKKSKSKQAFAGSAAAADASAADASGEEKSAAGSVETESGDASDASAALETARREGLEQLRRYSQDLDGRTDLKKALIIFIGRGEYEVVMDGD